MNILITLVYEKETVEYTICDVQSSKYFVNNGLLELTSASNRNKLTEEYDLDTEDELFGRLTTIFYNKQSIKMVIIK